MLTNQANSSPLHRSSIRHYFIDEGGDSNLFSKTGKVLVGTEGCSRFFILGLLDVPNPTVLKDRFDALRAQLMRDSYFTGVPSMQPNARKTAVAFHAKDDLPEVRREVFRILRDTEGLRFYAVVADKLSVLEYVRQRNKRESDYRYHPNELYDYLTECLFKQRLSHHNTYNIVFSKRGNSHRLTTLQELVGKTSGTLQQQKMHVSSATPKEHAGLQAVDYFVWALQRLYERDEERFLLYIWDAFRIVHDIDDTRKTDNGTFYTEKNPLTAEVLQWRK